MDVHIKTLYLFFVSALLNHAAFALAEQARSFGVTEASTASAITTVFSVPNTGKTPLTILRLAASCGCTAALPAGDAKLPVTVVPGQSLSINVVIDPYHLTPGHVDKSVAVYAVGHKDPIEVLRVTGAILPPVAFSPSSLDYGSALYGTSPSFPLSVSYDDSITPTGANLELKSSSASFVVSPAASSGNASQKPHLHYYTVQLDPGHLIGHLAGKLTAYLHPTSGKPIELGDISCYADVQGEITAVPQVIAFGQSAHDKPTTQTFLIEGKDLTNLKSASTYPYVSVTLGPIEHNSGLGRPFGAPAPKPGEASTLETVLATVTLLPSEPTGALQSSVVLTTTDGEQLTLPVYAVVEK